MAFTLHGRPAGGRGPFMRNPTSCRPAVTTVVATPYGGGPPKSRTSRFTPTACGALRFAPQIRGTVGARGMTARQSKPPVTTVISQGAGQAGQSAATVTLPPVVAPDLAQLSRACPADKADARACPASSKVGTVTAGTPLLKAPLTGDVFLVSRGPGSLPGLTIQLADPIPLRLDGTVALTPAGLRTTFTGLPDVPLASFRLDLSGGPTGAFQLGSDVCAGAAARDRRELRGALRRALLGDGADDRRRLHAAAGGRGDDPPPAHAQADAAARRQGSGRRARPAPAAAAAAERDHREAEARAPRRAGARPTGSGSRAARSG